MQIPSAKPLLKSQLPSPHLRPRQPRLLLVSPLMPSAIGLSFTFAPLSFTFSSAQTVPCLLSLSPANTVRFLTPSCPPSPVPCPGRPLHLLGRRPPGSITHVERTPWLPDLSHDKFGVPLSRGFSKMSKILSVASLKSFSHFSHLFLSLSVFKPCS